MLIHNAVVLTMNQRRDVILNGAVVISGGKIIEVGKSEGLLKKYPKEQRFDACGKTLMPGLVNAHTHLYSTFACGMPLKAKSPKNFPEILKRLWWRLDKALFNKAVRLSAMLPLISAIRLGTTTLIDHHSSPSSVAGSLDIIADCYREIGLRGAMAYEVSDRNGVKNIDEGIRENVRFIEKARNSGADGFMGALFGLHAAFTLSDKSLKKCVDAASALDAGFHIHLAEDVSDFDYSKKKFKMSVAERLYKHGILCKKTIAAHCVHLDDMDYKLLAMTQTKVIHNPRSNMNNAVGRMRLEEMAKNDVFVGMGSDGMSSGMWDELKTAYLIHKHDLKDPRFGWDEVFRMLFINNPLIASEILNIKTGVIAADYAADIILLDYMPATPISGDNMLGHIYFRIAEAPVDSTIVGGKFLMKNKRINIVDEAQITREALKVSKEVWEKF